jgi:hypothetical protein
MTSPRAALPTGTSSPSLIPQQTHAAKPKVLFVFGTRPEAIKLCPLIRELRDGAFSSSVETVVCVTGQHREMLDTVLEAFQVKADHDLAVMQPGQALGALNGRLMTGLDDLIGTLKPTLVIVQGDTTSTFCGALAAFYARVPVAHVEAGLRTNNLNAPFPEELNRVLTGRIASLHFCRNNLGCRQSGQGRRRPRFHSCNRQHRYRRGSCSVRRARIWSAQDVDGCYRPWPQGNRGHCPSP